MSQDTLNLVIGKLQAVPIEPSQGGTVVVTVISGGTVYYADRSGLTATSNQGSLAAGASHTFTGAAWLLSASVSNVQVISIGAVPHGTPTVQRFPFAHDTPGLLTGYQVYVPAVGEILLDAWFTISEAWNGTTPQGDLGFFTGTPGTYVGLYNTLWDPIDVSVADGPLDLIGPGLDGTSAIYQATEHDFRSLPLSTVQAVLAYTAQANHTSPAVRLAGSVLTGEPVKVVVSQDGTPTGADPVATQGQAALYLVTATPV